MKKVDIVTSMSLKAGMGPVQTVKRIINSRDFFIEKGYDINVFSLDCVSSTIEENFKSKQ